MRDIENSLSVLNDNGTILCHDMLPTSELIQAVPRVSGIWTGDCWKAWAKLRGTRKDLEMFIVQDDWGVGVIRVGNQKVDKSLNKPIEEMDWSFFCENKDKFNYISSIEFEENHS